MANKYHIRWLIKRDMAEVMAIENACFEFPWTETDFIHCLRQKNCIGHVAEQGERVVGYSIYALHKHRVHLLSIAVHPAHRHLGVGREMVDKLVGKLGQKGRTHITTEVRERNLDAQLFFKRMGFEATDILRDYYDDSEEDAYCFEYRVRVDAEVTA